MASKPSQQHLSSFYERCQQQKLTDMQNSTHALKAKVIAKELGLNYSHIDKLYKNAKEAYRDVQAEKSKHEEYLQMIKIDGTEFMKLIMINDDVLTFYRRPNGTIYYQYNKSTIKIEGNPAINLVNGGVTVYEKTPSKTIFTAATVGGITTGGFHQTKGGISHSYSGSGKADTVHLSG